MTYKNKGFGVLAFIIAIAVIAVIGGGAYYKTKNPKVTVETKNVVSDTATSTSVKANTSVGITLGSVTTGSIRSLFDAGRDLMCTVEYATTTPIGDLKTMGTIYVAGNEMRGDFTMEGKAAIIKDSHMIRQGDSFTAWTGTQGAKISMSNLATSTSSTNGQVGLDQNISYKCTDWTKDSSKFVVPSTVKIMDVSDAMTKIKSQFDTKVQTGR